MTPELITTLVLILTPVIVWLITAVIKPFITGKFSGVIIVGVVVPVLSLLATWIGGMILPETNWLQLVVGLLAVFIRELIKQLKPQA